MRNRETMFFGPGRIVPPIVRFLCFDGLSAVLLDPEHRAQNIGFLLVAGPTTVFPRMRDRLGSVRYAVKRDHGVRAIDPAVSKPKERPATQSLRPINGCYSVTRFT